uniref:Uncharacterized protein n=1 Tax=Knipowitschia caucasica TaxID=637954 RepID=A0AAV2KC34_KNICA
MLYKTHTPWSLEVSRPGLGPHSRLGIPPETTLVLWSPGPVWFPVWYTQKATKTPGNRGPARGVVAKVMDRRSSVVGSNPARGPCLSPPGGSRGSREVQRVPGGIQPGFGASFLGLGPPETPLVLGPPIVPELVQGNYHRSPPGKSLKSRVGYTQKATKDPLEASFPGWNMREWAQENQGKNHRSPPGKSLKSRVGYTQKATKDPLEASFPGWNMREWAQENQGKNHRSPPGKSLRSRVGDFQILPGSYIDLKAPIKRGPPLDPARGRVVKVMDWSASTPGSKPGDTIDGLRQIFKSAARTRPVMVVLKPGLSPDSRIGYFQ